MSTNKWLNTHCNSNITCDVCLDQQTPCRSRNKPKDNQQMIQFPDLTSN